ncbi:MAG: T9SS type A sorting domain-containing protein [Bacteroidota bacterium]
MNLKNQQNRLKRPSKTYLGLEKLISVYGNKKFVCGNEKFVYGNEISVHGCKIFVYGNKNSVYGNKKFVYGKIISVLGKKISVYKKKISVVVYKIIQVGFFVNSFVQGTAFHGIFISHSSGQISQNNFTDMSSSIYVDYPLSLTTIENNTIEILNSAIFGGASQIIVDHSTAPVIIYSNTISNSTLDVNYSATNIAAINVSNSSFLDVRSNQIKGFQTGICFLSVRNSEIVENAITDSYYYGIYVGKAICYYCVPPTQTTYNIYVGCNTIDLHNDGNQSTNVGIAFYHVDLDPNNNPSYIYSNCILNTINGIYLEYYPPNAGSACNTIPVIRNNFVYNYSYCGIYNLNYGGTIGDITNQIPATNTLASNNTNHASVYDIYSVNGVCALSAWGNWLDAGATAGLWSVVNNKIYSNASCAHQLNTFDPTLIPTQSNYDWNTMLSCNEMTAIAPYYNYENGKFKLSQDYEKNLQFLKGDKYDNISNLLYALSSNTDKTSLSLFIQAMNQSTWVNEQEKLWINYYYNLTLNNYNQAVSILSSINPLSVDELDLKHIETININLMQDQYPTSNEFNILDEISSSWRINTNYATSLLMLFNKNNEPKYYDELYPTYESLNHPHHIGDFIEVYPNPAKNQLTINLLSKGKLVVRIEDITGRQIKTIEFNDESITQSLDISGLSQGVYLIVASDEKNNYIQRTKFIKL